MLWEAECCWSAAACFSPAAPPYSGLAYLRLVPTPFTCFHFPPRQVYRAICKPYQEEVAVKLLDLENMNCSLDEIVREAQAGAGWAGGRPVGPPGHTRLEHPPWRPAC